LPRPSAPRIAIDSPLQAPHSIHRIVGFRPIPRHDAPAAVRFPPVTVV
jgi:hypothetical protein